MPDMLPRRRILIACATTLPVLLATAGCRSSDVFAGPDPLAGRPPLAPDVVTLMAVIAAEENLISLYRSALADDSRTRSSALKPLLGQHEQHLAQLRGRLVEPPGAASAQASPQPPASSRPASSPPASSPPASSPHASSPHASSPHASSPPASSPSAGVTSTAPGHVTIARLRAAEHASATSLVQRLATVEPALAQLFASIAASDATHVTALETS